jgi:hypothetical protein
MGNPGIVTHHIITRGVVAMAAVEALRYTLPVSRTLNGNLG